MGKEAKAMIKINNFVFDLMKKLDDLDIYNCLDIRSYKKNRKVIIEKLEDYFNLYEDGFYKEEYINLSREELKRLLRLIEKREFPRSNNIRFYILESKDSSACRANYREEIEKEEEVKRRKILIEASYSNYIPIKNIIEDNSDEIDKVDFSETVSVSAFLKDVTYNILKKYIKDRTDIKMYAC
ncbi:hypothetical protein [Clostridium sp.]|uniref:hypothetical protein n=2 Tax=Clostridium sp. TaxID=1506 RepID=UPI002FC8B177